MAGIHHTKSFSIEYNRNLNRDDATFVQLMDIPGGASSRSEISVEERIGNQKYGGFIV